MGHWAKAALVLAVLAYAAGITSDRWGQTLSVHLPEDYLFSLILGLAIGFQTLVIAAWQAGAGRAQRPLTALLITALVGGLGAVLFTLSVDLWRNALVTGAAGLAVMARPRLAAALPNRTRPCDAHARARDAGLATATLLCLLGLLVDLSGLVTLPLSLTLAIGGWIAAMAYTAAFWWHQRRAD